MVRPRLLINAASLRMARAVLGTKSFGINGQRATVPNGRGKDNVTSPTCKRPSIQHKADVSYHCEETKQLIVNRDTLAAGFIDAPDLVLIDARLEQIAASLLFVRAAAR